MADYEIFSVKDYENANSNFINKNSIHYKSINELCDELQKDNYYHFRVHKNKDYTIFGDLDNFQQGIDKFKEIFIDFLKNKYNIDVENDDIKYTINNKKFYSFHYSVPKLYGNLEKIKEIHNNLLKIHKDIFIFQGEKKVEKCVDTTIYSEHWYRCPNQSKGNIPDISKNNKHVIISGEMKDFIIYYIPEDSQNINDYEFIEEIAQIEKKYENKVILNQNTNHNNQLTVYNTPELSSILNQSNLYKKMFDECYRKERFEIYEYWISIGMAIKNTFLNEEEAFDLFNYYSAKGSNYEGYEKTKYKYATFIKKNNTNGYTVATIHFYAIEDNKPKFIEIMNKNTFELGQTDFCKYLKIIAGYRFIYKKYDDYYKLYCYNGTNWECDDVLFRKCLSSELYDFLKTILIEVYWNHRDFNSLRSKIEKLKTMSYKRELV